MRKNTLLAASSLFLLAASVVVPSQAQAACSDAAGRCGDGEGSGITYSHQAPELLPAIGFNWAQQNGIGAVLIWGRVRAGVGLTFAQYSDPTKGGYQPLFTVDLHKAPLTASWTAEDKIISVQRVDAVEEHANFQVRYTLRPTAYVAVDTSTTSAQGPWSEAQPGSLLYYSYNLTGVVSDVLGNENFGIHGSGDKTFAPWGLTGINAFLVRGGGLDPQANSALFTQPWGFGDDPETPEDDPDTNGTFGVFVQSNPEFSYKTLTVKYQGQDLSTDSAIELPQQSEYGNELEVPVQVRGGVRIDGNIQARPFLHVAQLFGVNINQTVSAGFEQATAPVRIPTDPQAMIEFDFPTTSVVKIPIPNVKLERQSLEFDGTAGSQASGKLRIRNEGKAAAKVTFEADGDFQISSQATEISPGANFELTVRATRNEAGTVTGTVKVFSNDPDSPLQTFDVAAEFEADDDDDTGNSSGGSSSGGRSSSGSNGGDDDKGSSADADEDSGCGCKTANQTPGSALGGLGLVMAVVGLLRRRRA